MINYDEPECTNIVSYVYLVINDPLIPYYRNHFQNDKENLFSSKFPKTGRTAKAVTITGLY